MIALAANTDCKTLIGLGKIICQINQLLNTVVPVLLALGVVYFIWGVAQYVIAGEDETKKKGKKSNNIRLDRLDGYRQFMGASQYCGYHL